MNINEFINKIGFHDNWILKIEIDNHDLKIFIDDLDANLIKDETELRAGYIEIKNCISIIGELLIDYWIVSCKIFNNCDLVTIRFTMNNGSILSFTGQEINVFYDYEKK